MQESDFLGTGMAFPFALRDGALELAPGSRSIRDSILLILRTSRGERVMRPDFGCGLGELVFAENNTSTATIVAETVKNALLEFEPRIDVTDVQVSADALVGNRLNIDIEYLILSSNSIENLVYPFYLESGA